MTHNFFMRIAWQEAKLASDEQEVPVGAVIVSNGKIIAKAHNQTELLGDVTAHAEMLAITAATNYIGSKYLTDCTLYVTLEPCAMCAGALAWAQIGTVVYGASDSKRGCTKHQPSLFHPKTVVVHGVMEDESASLLSSFFSQKR